MSDLTLCSNTLGKLSKELTGPIFGSLNVIKGHAEGSLVVVFCEELDIASLSCAVTQQV